MLKKIRILCAALIFIGVCLLFLDASGFLPVHLAFLAKIQIVPAILTGSIVIVLALLAFTFVLGRVYCSVVCPLGVFQDIVGFFGRKRRFYHTNGKTLLRGLALGGFIAAFLLGIPILFGVLEPYSAFGRVATGLLGPVWTLGNNGLAALSEKMGNYWVSTSEIWIKGLFALSLSLLTFLAIGLLAYRHGRLWCNSLCPVGAGLGAISRFSLFRTRIDKNKCSSCGLCEKSCKSSCIDSKAKNIDSSRCVACFNCIEVCPRDAIIYSLPSPASKPEQHGREVDKARRKFLVSAALLTIPASAVASEITEEQIPALTRKVRYERLNPVLPPGASSLQRYTSICTGCQLCVANCPNRVLGSFGNGVGALQPSLSFERGYCRVNCVTCSNICPTGAIRPVTVGEKSAIQIGRAVIERKRCIRHSENIECTTCSRNCPAGAINVIQMSNGSKDIAIDTERCIGCGACEYFCPVRPTAAIKVTGNFDQRRI